MIAPSGYWFREVMEKIWEAKTEEEAIKIAKEARQFIDIKLEGVGPVPKLLTESVIKDIAFEIQERFAIYMLAYKDREWKDGFNLIISAMEQTLRHARDLGYFDPGTVEVENVSTYPMEFRCSKCDKWAKVIDMNFCPGCGAPVKK